jgi:hypothetical protein
MAQTPRADIGQASIEVSLKNDYRNMEPINPKNQTCLGGKLSCPYTFRSGTIIKKTEGHPIFFLSIEKVRVENFFS